MHGEEPGAREITQKQRELIATVAQRVANTRIEELDDGIPRTNGSTIWLPLSDKIFTFDDLVGIASHEASHIRFYSPFNADLIKDICPQNPMLANVVFNLFEDFRVNLLLKKTYLGFWRYLNDVEDKVARLLIDEINKTPRNVLDSDRAASFVLSLAALHQVGKNFLFYDDRLKTPSNAFKFASESLGIFWRQIIPAFKYVAKMQTVSSSVIATTIYIRALNELLNNHEKAEDHNNTGDSKPAPETPNREPRDTSGEDKPSFDDKANSQKSRNQRDHAIPETDREPIARPPGVDRLASQKIRDEIELHPKDIELSGVENVDISTSEWRRLEKIKTILRKGDVQSIIDLPRIMEADLLTGKEEIEALIKIILVNSKHASFSPELSKTEMFKDDSDDVMIKVIDTASALKYNNDVKDPEKIYQAMVDKNRYCIQELRKALSSIRRSSTMERMQRRGIPNVRDLVRVVSSKGQFDRPFMAPIKAKGARLLIAVDESGSMQEFKSSSRTTDESGRIQIARNAIIILAEAMKDTRIDLCIVGYSAIESEKTIVEKIYKAFGEKTIPAKLGSIACSDHSINSRDGTSFKSIARRHFKGPGDVPVMIIISDGQPNHSGTGYVGSKAEQETEKAVHELKRWVKMFVLSLDHNAEKYLEPIYGSKKYILLSNPSELVDKLVYLARVIAEALA